MVVSQSRQNHIRTVQLDLVALAEGETRAVTTDEFILEIRQRLEKML